MLFQAVYCNSFEGKFLGRVVTYGHSHRELAKVEHIPHHPLLNEVRMRTTKEKYTP